MAPSITYTMTKWQMIKKSDNSSLPNTLYWGHLEMMLVGFRKHCYKCGFYLHIPRSWGETHNDLEDCVCHLGGIIVVSRQSEEHEEA